MHNPIIIVPSCGLVCFMFNPLPPFTAPTMPSMIGGSVCQDSNLQKTHCLSNSTISVVCAPVQGVNFWLRLLMFNPCVYIVTCCNWIYRKLYMSVHIICILMCVLPLLHPIAFYWGFEWVEVKWVGESQRGPERDGSMPVCLGKRERQPRDAETASAHLQCFF